MNIALLRYVGDLLITTHTLREEKWGKKATEELLERLQKLGDYVSAKKARVCSNEVTYLGNSLRAATRGSCPQAVLDIPEHVSYTHLTLPTNSLV